MSITMTTGVPEWFADQFAQTIYHVFQQKESKFAQAVSVEPVLNAEDKAFDMMGTLSLEEKTSANEETPTTDPSTQRRWLYTSPFHQGILKDQHYDLSLLNDPTSDFVLGLRNAANRKKDDLILTAFDATVVTGRNKGSTLTWASANGNVKFASGGRTIAHDTSEGNAAGSGADLKMCVEKIQLALQYFAANDVDEDMAKWIAVNPAQFTNLLGQVEYTSRDYNGGGAPLATGNIVRNWMGLNWILTNKVTLGTNNDVDGNTNVYRCPCWVEGAIKLGVQKDVSVDISVRNDRSNSQQIYIDMNMGAMRIDEDGVCFIECQA